MVVATWIQLFTCLLNTCYVPAKSSPVSMSVVDAKRIQEPQDELEEIATGTRNTVVRDVRRPIYLVRLREERYCGLADLCKYRWVEVSRDEYDHLSLEDKFWRPPIYVSPAAPSFYFWTSVP